MQIEADGIIVLMENKKQKEIDKDDIHKRNA